jgi:hypothetical protein
VELVVGRPSRNGQLEDASVVALATDNGWAAGKSGAARWRFRAEARLELPGRWACGVRLRPNERDEPSPALADLVLWV